MVYFPGRSHTSVRMVQDHALSHWSSCAEQRLQFVRVVQADFVAEAVRHILTVTTFYTVYYLYYCHYEPYYGDEDPERRRQDQWHILPAQQAIVLQLHDAQCWEYVGQWSSI